MATRQIRPPPLSQHLREFGSRPDAWVVLARNMIPVVGIYAFGWSAAVSVFNYWFDGLTALAAIVAALVPRALRETQSRKEHVTLVGNVVRGLFVWLLLVSIVGLPYWIVLLIADDMPAGVATAAPFRSKQTIVDNGSQTPRTFPEPSSSGYGAPWAPPTVTGQAPPHVPTVGFVVSKHASLVVPPTTGTKIRVPAAPIG